LTMCAERIAGFHGSQCGFCTPGMVVACHTALSIAHSKGESCSATQMEKAFDGNLCRCTGYRPILDACKVSGGPGHTKRLLPGIISCGVNMSFMRVIVDVLCVV